MELSLLRAPHLHDYFHRREPRTEIEIKVSITPQQYVRLDNMARRMRRPMDKALGWMVTHHMDSILENTHISAPAGPKPIDWGAIE